MSSKDRIEQRKWMKSNPGLPAEVRDYFTLLDRDLRSNNIWSTTTTTTSSTTSTSSTSSSTSSTSSTTSSSSTSSTASTA